MGEPGFNENNVLESPYSRDYHDTEEKLKRFIIPHAAEGPTTHDLFLGAEEFKLPVSFHVEDGRFFMTGLKDNTEPGVIVYGHISEDLARIKHIDMAKDLKGKGVGTALIDDLEEQLGEAGVGTVYSTFANAGTIDFFRKQGYEITSLKALTEEEKRRLDIEDEDFDTEVENSKDYEKLKADGKHEFWKVIMVKRLNKGQE